MNNEEIRICLTGGATGGHFFPLVFVARELKKRLSNYGNYKIFYLGSKPFSREILEKEGIDLFVVPEIKLRRYFTFKNIIDLIKLPISMILIFYYLFRLMPNVIFSKGGPTTFLVVLIGWFFRIPIIIHESDAIPGLSNRLSGFFSDVIILSFEESKKYFTKKTIVLGHPIDYNAIEKEITEEDYKKYGLKRDKKIVLFLGGSQGSEFLNEVVIDILPDLLNYVQVVHQIGTKHYQDTYLYAKGVILEKNKDKLNDYHPFEFIDNNELITLIKMSDLVVSRAGAGTIFEISALGKPSILIPLSEKVSNAHQIANAEIYSNKGACKTLMEDNFKPHILLTLIKEILNNDQLALSMSKAAYEFSKPDAVLKITEVIMKFI